MKTRCRPFQVAWMESLDEGRAVPVEVSAHGVECPDCRAWVRYLEAERQAVARWTPPEVPPRAWVPILLRRKPTRRLVWAWALAGLTLIALGVGLWREVYRPLPPPTDADLTDVATLWTDADISAEAFDEETLSSYLDRSGLWWTEADLQALEQAEAPPSDPARPLDFTDPRPTGYARLAV